MDDFEKEQRIKKLLIIVTCVVTAVLVVVYVLLAMSNRENIGDRPTNPSNGTSPATSNTAGTTDPQPTVDEVKKMKELLLQDVSEQGNVIVATTTYCAVSYPVGFEEIMTVEVQNQETDARIVFYATIGGEKYALYAFVFNGQEGMTLGSVRVDGEIYRVRAIFYDPEGLSDEGLSTFNAAQETFNDAVISLEDNDNFLSE